MPANPKLSSEVHPGTKKIVLLVYTVKFKIRLYLQLCILRNLQFTVLHSPLKLGFKDNVFEKTN